MAETHTNITNDKSGNQVVFHNPGQHPLPAGAGQPITIVKTAGSTSVQGTVPNTGVIISNPA